ncbi:MAG: AtpZ/AtpI family protein [Bacteroidia bacterium]|nr:AtpZ/AtpI family protein [Bacteroidia bacterium]MCX7651654.1 AtpZ/AtpI family protein [Bacteroidia bacterium]MDW8417188.1 AtpZ/AtpI family protein [Bacteroidia bacterium]
MAAGLGVEIVSTILLWMAVGYLADKYVGIHPYGLLGGGLLGVGHVVWRLSRIR